MPENAERNNNANYLLTHLDENSLAYKLVQAHENRESGDSAEDLKAVLEERLKQLRDIIDNPEN